MRCTPSKLLVLTGLLLPSMASAATYSEAVNGDLSGNRALPTAINLDPGSNTISATSVAGDVEYFRVNVPAGFRISAITLDSFSAATNLSFVAVQSGAAFTEPPTPPGPTNVAQLLGYTHFSAAQVGTNILDDIGVGAGSIGFTGPLTQSTYTFWSQETAGSPSSYTFNVSVTPAPSVPALGVVSVATLGLGLLALMLVGGRRRSRRI